MGLLILQESKMQDVDNEMPVENDVIVAVDIELPVQIDLFNVY